MASETRRGLVTPVGIGAQDWWPGARTRSRPFVTVGLAVIVSLVLVGLSVVASGFVVHTVNAALFSGGQGPSRSETAAAGQQSLKVQNELVEERRAAVATYAASLREFKIGVTRPPGAAGINLGAEEARRREDVLTGLVLECIDAVNGYNLAAQSRSATQLRSAGLPERFVWAVNCASGQ